MIRAKDTVEGLTAYQAPLEGRRGMLRLDFNENTVGPSPKVMEAIAGLSASDVATYPEYAGLADAFAGLVGVSPQEVGVFNGVDAAIRAVFEAFGSEGETFLSTNPTFGYYGPCAAQQGMRNLSIPYGPDLEYPKVQVLEALSSKPRIYFVCNPNNPTGTLVDAEFILDAAARNPETLVVVDELYESFTGVTVLPAALEHDNLLTLRSLSKSAGLAGLRLGFAIGAAALVDRVSRVTGPYDVNSFAVTAGKAAIADYAHTEAYVAEVKKAKALTIERLGAVGLRYHADGGNYVLVWPGVPLDELVGALRDGGVLVRSMAGKPLIDGSFRLTIGTSAQMERFFEVFEDVLAGLAQSS